MELMMLAMMAVVIVAGIAAAGCAAMCYRAGLRDGLAVSRNTDPGPVLPERKPNPPEETEQDKRIDAILANVEAYDGTGIGQEDVN